MNKSTGDFIMSDSVKGVISTLMTILLGIVSFFLIQINGKFNVALDVIQEIKTDVKVNDTRVRTEYNNMRDDVDSNTEAIKALQDGQLEREKNIGLFYKDQSNKAK